MGISFDDWAGGLDERAAAEAAAGDDTRARLSSSFAAPFGDEQHRLVSVPDQLAAARKARQLSPAQLSQLTGVDQAAISRIERGQINASIETVSRLSKPLGLHVALVDEQGRTANL